MKLLTRGHNVCIMITAERYNDYLGCHEQRLLFQNYCTVEEWENGEWIKIHREILLSLHDPFRPLEQLHPFTWETPRIPGNMTIIINGTRMEWYQLMEKLMNTEQAMTFPKAMETVLLGTPITRINDQGSRTDYVLRGVDIVDTCDDGRPIVTANITTSKWYVTRDYEIQIRKEEITVLQEQIKELEDHE